MNRVYLLLGSNLDNRSELIRKSRELIKQEIGNILTCSSIYESEPWGFRAEISFLNQVLLVETELSPQQILNATVNIENNLGRQRKRSSAYESRTIDIDILFYNNSIIQLEDLEIPHPKLHERLFTLIPMQEIDGNHLHPVVNKTISQLTKECPDECQVVLYEAPATLDNLL